MGVRTPPPLSKPEDNSDLSNQFATIANHTPTFIGLAYQKKGTIVRSWLVLNSTAQTMRVEAGKLPSFDARVYPIRVFRSPTRFFRTRRRSWVEKGPS
ncbi:hypothetical protein V6N13_051525 [Hibiscus sabdariffa]|uniref:Uncharacterized protein n=2 Tax=Hibiscus sabdariffa TaxID=183260 RepID=A0ABR2T4I3_9ROSI